MSLDAVIRINRAIVAIEVMLKLDCKFTLNNKKKPKTKILFLNKICIFCFTLTLTLHCGSN